MQASIQAKTYVISGPAETKTIQELLPGIIQQLGGDNIQALSKQFSEQMAQGGMDPALVEEGEALQVAVLLVQCLLLHLSQTSF